MYEKGRAICSPFFYVMSLLYNIVKCLESIFEKVEIIF